jgi:hypothetical protein
MSKRWCHNHKTWTRQLETRAWYGQMGRSPRCSLHQEEFTFGEHRSKLTIRNAWFQQWNTWEVLWWFGQQYLVQYSVGPIVTLHGRITSRKYMARLGNQVHPMIQTLFPKTAAVFQDSALINIVGTADSLF